ncbi:hypothetical protein WMF26_41985 [Sorangium sp. So ce185]|uniref:hypothetical protein n=1 Tax=Sorangium sp. So ce185 TaxID=3133287 RepID=UPI003F610386
MTNRNPNKSSPGQPAGQGAAGDAAPPPQQQRGYEAPSFAPQEHPSQAQQRALSQDPRRRPDEAAPAAAAPPVERMVQWGEPRPRRRQDREAGPSDKQVYVPPVTLPPNREHQAMDLQKIQVAPSLLKGVDERNRPTMRRIPVHGMPGPPQAVPEGPGSARTGVRTARVGVGSGVWPPPEEPTRKQRLAPAPAPQPAGAAPRAGVPQAAARPDAAVAAAASAAALAARRRAAPLGLFALLVFLGSATVAGFWVLWRAANPPVPPDAPVADDGRAPTPEPGLAAPTPSAMPEPAPTPPPVATVEPPPTAEPAPAASNAPPTSPAAEPSASSAPSGAVAARPFSPRPAAQAKRPPRPAAPEDVYESSSVSPPLPPPLPSVPSALPTTPPGTTAPPRPFP